MNYCAYDFAFTMAHLSFKEQKAPLASCSDPSGVFAVARLSPAQLLCQHGDRVNTENVQYKPPPIPSPNGGFVVRLTIPHYPMFINVIQIGFCIVFLQLRTSQNGSSFGGWKPQCIGFPLRCHARLHPIFIFSGRCRSLVSLL